MLIDIIFTFVAAVAYLFFFWKKLKEDYTQNQIFTTGFYCLSGVAFSSIMADNFAPNWWFWASLLGSFAGMVLGLLRFKLRFFETLEAWVIANIVIAFIVVLSEWVKTAHLAEGFALFVVGLLFFLFLFLDSHYKKFTWYKSGKIGFTGLSVLGIFFIIRSLVALTEVSMVSFVGKVDAILSAVVAFASFLTLFNLARLKQ